MPHVFLCEMRSLFLLFLFGGVFCGSQLFLGFSGHPFKAAHDGEDEYGRQRTATDENAPKSGEADFFPKIADDADEVVSDGRCRKPTALHKAFVFWRGHLGDERNPHRAEEQFSTSEHEIRVDQPIRRHSVFGRHRVGGELGRSGEAHGANKQDEKSRGGDNHADAYLARGRRFHFFAVQPFEQSHKYGREDDDEHGIELLEYLRRDSRHNIFSGGRDEFALVDKKQDNGKDHSHDASDRFHFLFSGEDHVNPIEEQDEWHQSVKGEKQVGGAGHFGGGVVAGEEGHGESVLMEGHPKENDHGKHQPEGDEALLGLLGRELHDDGVFVSFAFRFFFFSGIGGFVIFAEAQEYGKGDNQADASHSESPLVRPAEDVDIVGGKRTQGVDSSYRDILVGGQGYQFFISGGAFGEGAALQLVGEGGDFTVVGEVRLVHERFRDLVGHAGSEEGSNVDAHVEDAEGQVPVFAVARRVVKVANEHLQVAFEKARADGDEGKGGNHDGQSASKGEKRVTEEHDDGAECDCFAVAEIFVGDESAKHREKVDRGQKDAEHLSGGGGGPAVPGLKVERENRKHGVVAESFSHVGES